MENSPIADHGDLISRIAKLKSDKAKQEADLNRNFSKVLETLSPASFVQETVKTFVHNEDLQVKITKAGLKMLSSFLVTRILKKHGTGQGFVSAALLERISTVLIDKNAANIVSGVKRLFKKREQPQEGTNQNLIPVYDQVQS